MNFKNKCKKRAIILGLTTFLSCNFLGIAQNSVFAQSISDTAMVTAEFKDTSIADTLEALSLLTGIPTIVPTDLSDKVNISIKNQSYTTVLNNLAKVFDFNWQEENGTILVSKAEKMTTTKTYKVQHMDLEQLKSDLKTFLPEESVNVSTKDNSLTVTTTTPNLKKVDDLLRIKDVKRKQVSIRVKLIEVSKSDQESLGFEHGWNTFDSALDSWKFTHTVKLNADSEINNAKILANPSISVMNGDVGKVDLTDEIPVLKTTSSNNETTTTIEFHPVGISLEVTPRISDDGSITMTVNPKVSVLTKMIEKNNVVAPQTSTRSASTTVRVNSNEDVVIAGLIKSDDIENINKIPLLGDLPLLGKFFQSKNVTKNNTELIVVISPFIEEEDTTNVAPLSMHDKKALDLEHKELHEKKVKESKEKTGSTVLNNSDKK